MNMENFTPIHINAEKGDFEGNGAYGRYVLIPGSDGRAEKIAAMWKDVTVKKHPRNHNLYLGKMETETGDIDMAVISTGMGAASADIIISELIALGARNLIRVGTSGSMQPEHIPAGSVVVPTGSVKDETTSARYLPAEVPAIPSIEFILAAHRAYEQMLAEPDGALAHQVFFGVVHSKDSLYAREIGAGPMCRENEEYMRLLKEGGVLASEMETSILFTLGQVYSQQCRNAGKAPVLTGAVLAVIGGSTPFGDKDTEALATDAAISFSLRTIEALDNMRS
ncbi:MAG: nucleoside phosphorylase [Clostridiaceae bacterium]|jgi:uridine phosphorylase|nr:nucleoside phosphorylase [Clostridiaceae bacterium]